MAAPGPPSSSGKGYQVRLYNQILGLADRHTITLLTFKAADETINPDLVTACKRVVAVPWSARSAASAALLHASRLPLSVGLFRNRRMAAAVASEIQSGCDLVQLQVIRMAPYLRESAGVPVILDLLDAAELNMRERARAAAPGMRQLWEIEARRLGAYERKAIALANLALLISRRDFEYLGSAPTARVLPNGIQPLAPVGDRPPRQPTTVVFTGTMSYFPNADAATWFAGEILPMIRRFIPAVQFRIVGREPNAAVRGLASQPAITVTGAVPDVSTEISRAAVSVCPMRFGSGMQTKILEAMAMETPVVATSKALEGIPEDLHQFLHRADSPDLFADAVQRILKEPDPALELARDGLEAIRREHTWKHMVDDLERHYEETVTAARR